MTDPIWRPSAETIAQSQMTAFMSQVNRNCGQHFSDYQSLHQWSITHSQDFWVELVKFTGVEFSTPWTHVLINSERMPGAKWFEGARLNFARHLLRHQSNKTALIFQNEKSVRTTLTYAELNQHVRRLAYQLKKRGVKIGDRVAGYLPNRPETIIAMLATTSLGAIWSSCSPDFGYHGVYDRFQQITPKILFACDGQLYNGKQHSTLSNIIALQENLPSLEHIIIVPSLNTDPDISNIKKSVLFENLVNTSYEIDSFEELPFDHPLYILFSSGTTGVPKCITHGAGGTLLQHLKELILHTDLREEDTITYYTTCGWMMWNWLVSSLAVGATVVLYDGSPLHPRPSRLFDLIDAEKISIFGTSAKFLTSVEKVGLQPHLSHSLTSLRTILSTGSPLVSSNYDFVYEKIKSDVRLSSISGGTDIISCFALGNPNLPVYHGELQCIGLGLAVEIFDDDGHSLIDQKGELVCTKPFPAMPIYFWNDKDGQLFHRAYFEQFPNVWTHGDYAQITKHGGLIIYGRSDTLLKPGGIRIGTAEIYREVEQFPEIMESIAIGQPYKNDVRIILFVKMRENCLLTEDLIANIRQTIKLQLSPHHVPAKILSVPDIPRTVSGKIVELAVQNVVAGKAVKNIDALANPEALDYFRDRRELQD
ncbi:MAG: acetoacetate--CoA ligase [Gammaproteobacteria bacterium]|nr:acetoacetate--CoA ligase [Gammaproteobacteria bacterium]